MTVPKPENLTCEECARYQQAVTAFAQLVMASDFDLVERYLKRNGQLADGTMDVIIPHVMSIHEMQKGRRKLKFLREMGRQMLAVRELVKEQVEGEAA